MAITNGYTDLATFKARTIPGTPPTDTTRDSEMEKVIQAVSRAIDDHCHRQFYLSASDESRYFTAVEPHLVFTDDIGSVTTLKTDEDGDGTYEITWASTDYRLMPVNTTPKMWIAIKPNGNYTFPTAFDAAVEVTGKFGYCTLSSCPDPVKEACILLAMRIWMRDKAPFAVVGGGDSGPAVAIPKFDPDVEALLAPYVRL